MNDVTETRRGKPKNSRRLAARLQPPANPLPPASRPRKATTVEFHQRVLATVRMMLDGRREHEIKSFFRTQYGIKFRQVSRYIRLARCRLAETSEVDVGQLRAEFFARYMEIFRTTENDGTKLSALRAAGQIYGVDSPRQVARTTVQGDDRDHRRVVLKGLTDEQLAVLRAVRDKMRQSGNGKGTDVN